MIGKIKLIIWLVILLLVAYFVSMNVEPQVSIRLLPTYKTPEVPMALIIIFSMIVGALVILIFTITDWISFKIEKLKLKRQINLLKSDLETCQKKIKKLEEEKNSEQRENDKKQS